MFRALIDTCVLFKLLLCDTLLCVAEEELFQPQWSAAGTSDPHVNESGAVGQADVAGQRPATGRGHAGLVHPDLSGSSCC